MRINASTGEFEDSVTFTYGDDLFLSETSTLLVGSRTEIPSFFTEDLTQTGPIGTAQRMFITQFLLP